MEEQLGGVEDAVARELISNAFGNDGGAELHDAAVGRHHPHHLVCFRPSTTEDAVAHAVQLIMKGFVSYFDWCD